MSNDDYKKRVQTAMENHHKSLLPNKRYKIHNGKPEAIFKLKLYNHIKSLGWSIDIIESAAVYNAQAGRYISGKARPGYSDMSGNTPDGIACFIECKAPQRRKDVRPDQHQFLTEKINANCFAIVCDSIEHFDKIYKSWRESDNKKSLLLNDLPDLPPRFKSDFTMD